MLDPEGESADRVELVRFADVPLTSFAELHHRLFGSDHGDAGW
jgi:hypothetical protein